MKAMLSRRSAIVGAGLAAPFFFIRNGWAEGKSINVGTFSSTQGEYIRRTIIPKFQADLGCRVYQTEGTTLGQIAIMRSQKANPTYSVMFMDDTGVPIAKDEGLIVPLPRDKMPNLARVLPRYVLEDGYAAAVAVSICSPYFNTQTVKSIESWADLWQPRFQGRIMLVAPKHGSSIPIVIAAAALATGKPLVEAQYSIEAAWDKLAELKPNVQNVYENNASAVLQVAQGQADVAGPEYSKVVLPYALKKAPVVMSSPKEGVFAGTNTIVLVKNAPNPDIGIAFADRMLDPDVQKGLAEATLAAPTISGLELSAEATKIVAYPEKRLEELNLVSIDWKFLNPKRGAIVEKLNQIFGA